MPFTAGRSNRLPVSGFHIQYGAGCFSSPTQYFQLRPLLHYLAKLFSQTLSIRLQFGVLSAKFIHLHCQLLPILDILVVAHINQPFTARENGLASVDVIVGWF